MKKLIILLILIPIVSFGQSELNYAKKLYKKGNYKKAQKEYSKFIKKNPNSSKAIIGLSNTYFKLEDYESTILYCNKCIELEPINLNAYNLRASSYYLTKEYKKAIKDYSKLIELNFKDLKKIYFMRGLCKSVLPNENVEGACSDFRKAKELGYETKQLKGLNKYCNVTDLE